MADAVETMFSIESDNQRDYGKATPWHDLGTVVEGKLTAQDAIVEAGLDWSVEQRDAVVRVSGGDGTKSEYAVVPNQFHNMRTSDKHVVGTVGNRYHVLQNREAFTFMDDLADDSRPKYVSAGSLFGGSTVWMLMQLPEQINLTDSDDESINQYILLRNSHDGSTAVTAAVTPIRVVCNNTLTMALQGTRRQYNVRHTQTMQGKLTEANKVLGIAKGYGKALEAVGKEMIAASFSNAEFDAFLESLVPTEDKMRELASSDKEKHAGLTRALNKQDEIKSIYHNTPDLQNIKGTKWGAFQAIVDYNDHHIDGRGNNKAENRMNRILHLPNITHDAFKMLTKV